MTLSWSIVLQSDFIMPIYTSLQYFYIISPVFQKIFFMNTIAMCFFLNGKTERLCCWPWTTSLCHLQSTPTLEDHLGDLSRPAFFQRTEVLIVLFQWPIYFFSPFLEFGIGSGTRFSNRHLMSSNLFLCLAYIFCFLT